MKKLKSKNYLNHPKNQTNLFGYNKYFNLFSNLFEKKKLPHSILITSPKGSGKATFVYHLINFFLSQNEENSYNKLDHKIDNNNSTYKLISNNLHPNFFLLDINEGDDTIKIEQVRNLLKFLNKTTYSNDIKFIIIDNIECLNVNSYNAILKSIEEPNINTYFFLIHHEGNKISDTIKSRCSQFRLSFNSEEKNKIFEDLCNHYEKKFYALNSKEDFYYNTPGNILKYFFLLEELDIKHTQSLPATISNFIDNYRAKKDHEHLNMINILIEKLYNNICIKKDKNLDKLFHERDYILKKIDDLKKYNLDEKIVFSLINEAILNYAK